MNNNPQWRTMTWVLPLMPAHHGVGDRGRQHKQPWKPGRVSTHEEGSSRLNDLSGGRTRLIPTVAIFAASAAMLVACGGDEGAATNGGDRDFHDTSVLEASLRAKTNYTVADIICPEQIDSDQVVCAAPGQSDVALNVVIQDDGRRYVATATRNAGTVQDTLAGAAAALLAERFNTEVDDTPYSTSGWMDVAERTGRQGAHGAQAFAYQLPLIPEQTLLEGAEAQGANAVVAYVPPEPDAFPPEDSVQAFVARPPVTFMIYGTVAEANAAKDAWSSDGAYAALARVNGTRYDGDQGTPVTSLDTGGVLQAVRDAGGIPEPRAAGYVLALFYAPISDEQETVVAAALDEVAKLKQ